MRYFILAYVILLLFIVLFSIVVPISLPCFCRFRQKQKKTNQQDTLFINNVLIKMYSDFNIPLPNEKIDEFTNTHSEIHIICNKCNTIVKRIPGISLDKNVIVTEYIKFLSTFEDDYNILIEKFDKVDN